MDVGRNQFITGDLVVTKAGAKLTVGESDVTRPDNIATNGMVKNQSTHFKSSDVAVEESI